MLNAEEQVKELENLVKSVGDGYLDSDPTPSEEEAIRIMTSEYNRNIYKCSDRWARKFLRETKTTQIFFFCSNLFSQHFRPFGMVFGKNPPKIQLNPIKPGFNCVFLMGGFLKKTNPLKPVRRVFVQPC